MKKFFLLLISSIVYPVDEEYYQHRNTGLQMLDVPCKYEKLEKNVQDIFLKNMFSLLSFTEAIESLPHQELQKFTQLLEQEYEHKKTVHHLTDLTIARIFLERKYPHLHIATNQAGLSNVYTDTTRINTFIFNLYLLQYQQESYFRLIDNLEKIHKKFNTIHAQLNFTIALSLADETLRKKFINKNN